MGRQSKKRREKRSLAEAKKATPTLEELIRHSRYDAVIPILRERIEKEPTDDLKRLLADCFLKQKQFQEAIAVFDSVEAKRSFDLLVMAWLYIQLEQWIVAIDKCKEALLFEESAETYYWLCVAEAHGHKKTYGLTDTTKAAVIEYLNKAATLANCRLEVFEWLEDFEDYWTDEGIQRKINYLQKALELYPEAHEARLNLVRIFITRLKDIETALEVIARLLNEAEPPLETFWYTYKCYLAKGDYETALSYLEKLILQQKNYNWGFEKVKGDLLFKLGRFDDALNCYEQLIIATNVDAKFAGWLSKAHLHLKMGKLISAIEDMQHIEEFVVTSPVDGSSMWGDIDFYFTHHFAIYRYDDCIEEVCKAILDHNRATSTLKPRVVSILYYLWYKILPETSDERKSLLLRAAELADYPHPSYLLSNYFAADGDIALAVHHHLISCMLLRKTTKEFIYDDHEFTFYNEDAEENIVQDKDRLSIHEVAMKHLRACNDAQAMIDVFVPFYDHFWRKLLFDGQLFKQVAEATTLFARLAEGEEGLFDYAYSQQELNNTTAAEEAYRRLLDKEPKNSAALNNLGVIAEEKRLYQEAYDLFSQALSLDPKSELYRRNYNRLKNKLQAEEARRGLEQQILERAIAVGLSAEHFKEITEFYWETDLSTSEIQRHYGVSKLSQFIVPFVLRETCPNCGSWLAYKSRSAKKSDDKHCISCEHTSRRYSCRCAYCRNVRAEEQRRSEEERIKAIKAAFEERLQVVSTVNHVNWALSRITRKEKVFLKALMELMQERTNPTWEEVCDRAGVVGHKKYVEKLISMGLVLATPEGSYVTNPSVNADLIELPTVRRISPSMRFDVFQRDNHTCQYCGRKPPDVELVVDHLIPVALGGTDVFENLMTSCNECNSGKSAKLIQTFTCGFTKEQWLEKLRDKRITMLQNRRARLDEVITYWTECRNVRRLSDYDMDAIHIFIERYEPDWIKKAIFIASKRKPDNYVKYVGGTLRNWAKSGPPEHLYNPDSLLEGKKATEKQIRYIQLLLAKIEVGLGDFYHKSNYEDLTMLDARNLIEALTADYSEEDDEHPI